MRNLRKLVSGVLVASLLTGMMAVPAYAASKKRISSISLNITSEVKVGDKYGEETIEVEVRSGRCSFDYYDIENIGFEWVEEDVPEIKIYLQADDDYYFSLTNASSVKLYGATYVRATKQDSSQTLALTVKLPSLAESIGEQTEVTLTNSGIAYWEPVQGAGSYELRLYRNGTGIGASILTTTEPNYNFGSMISRSGSYQVRVRPVNKINTNNKGAYVESATIEINDGMVEAIKSGTAQTSIPMSGQWIHDGVGWWYRHSNGGFTKSNWEAIKDQWYMFDERGYMKTGWVEWEGKRYFCDPNSGAMLTNTTTPDGVLLDQNGNPKNG